MNEDPRSTARLAAETLNHVTGLIQSEVALVRAEFMEKISQAIIGGASLLVAAILLIPVAVVAMMALAAWFVELSLRPSLAYGAAALIGLVVVGGLALFGKARLSLSNLSPARTLKELRQNLRAAKRAL